MADEYRYLTVTLANGDSFTLTIDNLEFDPSEATIRVDSKYRVTAKSTWTLDP